MSSGSLDAFDVDAFSTKDCESHPHDAASENRPMAEASSDDNPLDALAEEFVARHRAGERPSVEDYAARYPQLADAIRDFFPGLVLMEGVRPDNRDATGPFQLDPTVGGGSNWSTSERSRNRWGRRNSSFRVNHRARQRLGGFAASAPTR
jgi:hypothetical protein